MKLLKKFYASLPTYEIAIVYNYIGKIKNNLFYKSKSGKIKSVFSGKSILDEFDEFDLPALNLDWFTEKDQYRIISQLLTSVCFNIKELPKKSHKKYVVIFRQFVYDETNSSIKSFKYSIEILERREKNSYLYWYGESRNSNGDLIRATKIHDDLVIAWYEI